MKFFVIFLLVFSFNNVFAQGVSTGRVEVIAVHAFGEVIVRAGDRGSNAPSCSAAFDRFVADLTTEHGQAMFSVILAAQAQGQQVSIRGTNQCDLRSNAETIQFVNLVL